MRTSCAAPYSSDVLHSVLCECVVLGRRRHAANETGLSGVMLATDDAWMWLDCYAGRTYAALGQDEHGDAHCQSLFWPARLQLEVPGRPEGQIELRMFLE